MITYTNPGCYTNLIRAIPSLLNILVGPPLGNETNSGSKV